MNSAPFRVRLGEIKETKYLAIDRLILDALAAGITVHILVKSLQGVTQAKTYLTTLGLNLSQICTEKGNPEKKVLHVHSIIDPVPSDDLGIDINDIFTPG